MKHVISDSSSLILLTKAELIEEFIENKKIYITEIVRKESIKRGKEKGKQDAYLLEKLSEEGSIEIKDPKKKYIDKVNRFFNLHKGEKEVIALSDELNLPLICDDKKAFNACDVLGIDHTTALNILYALFEGGKIERGMAEKSLDRLKEFGWYEDKLIEELKCKIGD